MAESHSAVLKQRKRGRTAVPAAVVPASTSAAARARDMCVIAEKVWHVKRGQEGTELHSILALRRIPCGHRSGMAYAGKHLKPSEPLCHRSRRVFRLESHPHLWPCRGSCAPRHAEGARKVPEGFHKQLPLIHFPAGIFPCPITPTCCV